MVNVKTQMVYLLLVYYTTESFPFLYYYFPAKLHENTLHRVRRKSIFDFFAAYFISSAFVQRVSMAGDRHFFSFTFYPVKMK